MSSYLLALILSHLKYPTIQNSGHISKMQLVLLMAATFPVPPPHHISKAFLSRLQRICYPELFACSFALKFNYALTGWEALQLVLYYGMMLLKRVFLFLKENTYLETQDFQPAQSFLHHSRCLIAPGRVRV